MSKNKGFTLIELLIVMAILGVLAAVMFPNYMAARERARDAKRKSDLKQIQKALEMYRQDQPYGSNPYPTPVGSYYFGSCGLPLTNGAVNYIVHIPCDAVGPTPYFYNPDQTNVRFTLCACIENAKDSDPEVQSACPISGVSCPYTSGKYYVVNEP